MTDGRGLLGAVLAGGEGRRLGGPKASVELAGRPMLAWALEAVREATHDEAVVVSSRPVPDLGVAILEDATSGAGPLGGLEAALAEAEARNLRGVLLLACDLPLVDGALLGRIAAALGGHAAVAPERAGGGVEPVCAAYAARSLAPLRLQLASEDRSLHALFRALGGHRLSAQQLALPGDALLNVNTPEDLRRAEAVLAARTAE